MYKCAYPYASIAGRIFFLSQDMRCACYGISLCVWMNKWPEKRHAGLSCLGAGGGEVIRSYSADTRVCAPTRGETRQDSLDPGGSASSSVFLALLILVTTGPFILSEILKQNGVQSTIRIPLAAVRVLRSQ